MAASASWAFVEPARRLPTRTRTFTGCSLGGSGKRGLTKRIEQAIDADQFR